ncbi:hypothetical protein DLJ49_12205 [Rhodovulum sp. 12E13]|uniref:hypothetical protein n=1 Tax=Rhodovulum sp. 12E13 TaxID=2203891 RepID=UPI000E193049|nr:hypothetical protein [Rhodovulum sp. 12E13]RDC72115.1 hypothetical protein DLJ49_12205 [Rhodovulum sp. 12E13]
MFFALGRLVLMLLVVSTVAYVSLWFYARAAQKERLERRWEEEGRPGNRDLFVQEGLDSERYALRRRLLLGVYAVPFTVLAIVVYFANYA